MQPLISADNHVFEPVTLWQENLPPAMRDRGPRLEQAGEWFVLRVEGMPDRKLTRVEPPVRPAFEVYPWASADHAVVRGDVDRDDRRQAQRPRSEAPERRGAGAVHVHEVHALRS